MTDRTRMIRTSYRLRHRNPLTGNERENVEEMSLYSVLHSWLSPVWARRRQVAVVLGAFLVLGSVVAFLLPGKFTARAKILPPENSRSVLSGVLTALPEVAARMLPPSSGTVTVQLYPEIAQSRTILTDVLDASYRDGTFREALAGGAEVNDEKLIEKLRTMFRGSSHPRTQLVLFELTGRDPELTAALLNEILLQMDRFLRTRVATGENMQRTLIEHRLREVADSLRQAEQQLVQFKEANRTTNLAPRLQLEEARLLREVEINSVLYSELTKQLELARISEAESTPILNVLEYAVTPIEPTGPRRTLLVFGFVAFGFLFAVLYLRLGVLLPDRIRQKADRILRLYTQRTVG